MKVLKNIIFIIIYFVFFIKIFGGTNYSYLINDEKGIIYLFKYGYSKNIIKKCKIPHSNTLIFKINKGNAVFKKYKKIIVTINGEYGFIVKIRNKNKQQRLFYLTKTSFINYSNNEIILFTKNYKRYYNFGNFDYFFYKDKMGIITINGIIIVDKNKINNFITSWDFTNLIKTTTQQRLIKSNNYIQINNEDKSKLYRWQINNNRLIYYTSEYIINLNLDTLKFKEIRIKEKNFERINTNFIKKNNYLYYIENGKIFNFDIDLENYYSLFFNDFAFLINKNTKNEIVTIKKNNKRKIDVKKIAKIELKEFCNFTKEMKKSEKRKIKIPMNNGKYYFVGRDLFNYNLLIIRKKDLKFKLIELNKNFNNYFYEIIADDENGLYFLIKENDIEKIVYFNFKKEAIKIIDKFEKSKKNIVFFNNLDNKLYCIDLGKYGINYIYYYKNNNEKYKRIIIYSRKGTVVRFVRF